MVPPEIEAKKLDTEVEEVAAVLELDEELVVPDDPEAPETLL